MLLNWVKSTKNLEKVRFAVRKFRNIKDYKRKFKFHTICKNHGVTRWGLSFEMVKLIFIQKETIEMIIENSTDVKIDNDWWNFMDNFVITLLDQLFDATALLNYKKSL